MEHRRLVKFRKTPLKTSRMKVRFVVLEPESKRGTYEVPLPIVVGRGNEARFRIQQDRISRKHCELFDRDGDVFVRDLGSTNGTFLDGEQIAASIRTPVPPGSVLRIGTIDIRIDYEGSGRLAPAARAAPAGVEDATAGFSPAAEAEPAEAEITEAEIAEAEMSEAFPSFDGTVPAEPASPAEPALPAEPAEIPDLAIEATPAAIGAEAIETQKAPEPGDFGGIGSEEPVIESFDDAAFGAPSAEAEPPADGSFDFLAGSKEEPPADDAELGDFFKGLN
jgi:predicted component of type VI protein secretion system